METMTPDQLIKFLKLLRETGCIDQYWKTRINEVITKMGGNLE